MFQVFGDVKISSRDFSRHWGHTPGGGGYSKKFYTGRLRPEVQLLTLLYTIFFRKDTLFVYLLLEKAAFSHTFLRRLMNKSFKQEVFS